MAGTALQALEIQVQPKHTKIPAHVKSVSREGKINRKQNLK